MKISTFFALFRFALLPIIAYCIFYDTFSSYLTAVILFSVIMLVHLFYKRKNDLWNVGSFFDTISDMVLILGILFLFWWNDIFWLLPLSIFLLRNVIVNVIRWKAASQEIILSNEEYGRYMEFFQHFLVLILLLNGAFGHALIELRTMDLIIYFLTVAAVLLAVFSVVRFVKCYTKKLNEIKAEGRELKCRELKTEKMIIFANQKSRGYHDGYRRRLLRKFAKRRNAEIIYLPKKADMFKGMEKKIGDAKQLIIAGGDGSFEAALNYKPFRKKSLGFFPLGSGNSFYAHFYKGKRYEYLRSRFKFKEIEIDVLEMEWEPEKFNELGRDSKKSKKLETLFLAAGVDAEIACLGKQRTQNGFEDYVRACAKTLIKGKGRYSFDLTIDNQKFTWQNCVNITLAKISYYGYGLRSLFYVKPLDGYVYGMAVVNRHSPIFNKWLRLWALLQTHLGIDKAPLIKFRGKNISIESEVSFPIQAGGEFVGYTKNLNVRVKRKQKVLVI